MLRGMRIEGHVHVTLRHMGWCRGACGSRNMSVEGASVLVLRGMWARGMWVEGHVDGGAGGIYRGHGC